MLYTTPVISIVHVLISVPGCTIKRLRCIFGNKHYSKRQHHLNVNLKLNINPVESLGTISGVISHKGIFVANAFVSLYKIDENNREVLVATTKTKQAGAYMFGKVKSGKYKVKAK